MAQLAGDALLEQLLSPKNLHLQSLQSFFRGLNFRYQGRQYLSEHRPIALCFESRNDEHSAIDQRYPVGAGTSSWCQLKNLILDGCVERHAKAMPPTVTIIRAEENAGLSKTEVASGVHNAASHHERRRSCGSGNPLDRFEINRSLRTKPAPQVFDG